MKILRLMLPMVVLLYFNGCATPQGSKPSANLDAHPHTSAVATNSAKPDAKSSAKKYARQATADPTAESTNIWSLIEDNIAFADQFEDAEVSVQLKSYANQQEYFNRTLDRAALYLPYVLEQVLEAGLPAEIALLPFIESGYNPFAHSPNGAAGLWQFIPATADRFKLQHNQWYDGRRDVVESTAAATQYFKALNQQFGGDWQLTLAAYNAGPGAVEQAIVENVRKGKSYDFQSLRLKAHTRSFIPKLVALTKVVTNPDKYGVTLRHISAAPDFAVVELTSPVDLNQAARVANISTDRIYHLNPGYSRWVTPPSGPYHLVVPQQSVADFAQKLAALPPVKDWQSHKEYVVASGDTLGRIASNNGTSVKQLASLNKMSTDQMLKVGQVLRIPAGYQDRPTVNQAFFTTYQIKAGDSLWKIAQSQKTTIKELMAWNNMSPDSTLKPGQSLKIYRNRTDTTSNYRVKSGDSLSSIASHHNVKLKDLLAWNNLSPSAMIRPGQMLKINK